MLSEESTVTPKPSSFEDDPNCLVQFFVVKPSAVKLSLVILFPLISSTPVVTFILYVVEKNKLEDGSTENVKLEFEDNGDDDIWIQVLKLSEETWKVPVQPVPDELVVTELLSTSSEKVIEILSFSETEVALFAGDVEITYGVVASTLKEVIDKVLLTFPAESVTRIVQSEYVPSLKEVSVIVFVPLDADVVEDEQEPPYVMVPALVDEKV